jgi:hypothetical protein
MLLRKGMFTHGPCSRPPSPCPEGEPFPSKHLIRRNHIPLPILAPFLSEHDHRLPFLREATPRHKTQWRSSLGTARGRRPAMEAPSSASRLLEHQVGQPFPVRLPPVLSFLLPVLLCGYPRIPSTSSLAFHGTSFSSRTLMLFSWKFPVTSYRLRLVVDGGAT